MPEHTPPRRIVTGHDSSSRSVVVSDGPPPASRTIVDGATFHDMWISAAWPPALAPTEPEPVGAGEPLGPPPDGSNVRIVHMPPGTRSPMHRTESLDYGVVLEGEVTLVLDGGSDTKVGPGELVVQRGTNHAWENRTDGATRVLFVMVGARFDPELSAALPEDAVMRDL